MQPEKGLPKECSYNIHFCIPFSHFFRVCEAVYRERGNILINLARVRSVLFWLNFSLAKMLKDQQEDEEDRKYILLPSVRRGNKLM